MTTVFIFYSDAISVTLKMACGLVITLDVVAVVSSFSFLGRGGLLCFVLLLLLLEFQFLCFTPSEISLFEID